MNETARQARQVETEFLAGVEANFTGAKGRQLRGTSWQMMRHNDRLTLRGFVRRWLFGRRTASVTIASVLTPPERIAAAAAGPPPPIDLGELVDHVRTLVTDPDVPHTIGVCSPRGFTDEARYSQLELPNINLVLVEPAAAGGWRVTGVNEGLSHDTLGVFDPTSTSRKVQQVRDEIEQRSADLLAGGISSTTLATRLELPEALVVEVFRQAAQADPGLMLTQQAGQTRLVRGAAKSITGSMLDRIRALFDRDGAEAEKISALAERRAALAQRRDLIYDNFARLEERESRLLADGRAASSVAARRRAATQIAHVRKEIKRQNTLLNMLTSQGDIISTHIHHLRLIQEGRQVELPDRAELTASAARAEELLASLQADADLASSLEATVDEAIGRDEEAAILKEFDQRVEPVTPPQPAEFKPTSDTDPEAPRDTPEETGPPLSEPDL